MSDIDIRTYVDGLLAGLETERYSWWTHWRELADYILPRRFKWLVTPNQANRGSPTNQHIIDSTGTLAARTLASGMMSGITSPTRPWFKLKLGRIDSTQTSPTSLWLAECERIMMLVFQESNFYNSIAIVYFDLVVFGTSAMLVYEDFENVVNFQNPCAGEYYLGVSPRGPVDTFGRKFVMTGSAMVKEFGKGNVPQDVQTANDLADGSGKNREWMIGHIIEPNTDRKWGVPEYFAFREVYWVIGSSDKEQLLRKRGYHEQIHVTPRWDLVSNDAYGRSPGMDALGDIKQLQQETRRKAQAIDKMVNPPMVADIQLKNQPASLVPGGVTYVAGMANNVGFKPVYQVAPPIKEILEDLNEVRARIKDIFFNDLFQMISQLETVRTATEIDARREEKLVLLGPVLERFENEGLAVIIERVFACGLRANIFPPPPQEAQGQPIQIEYVSMLAEAQKAARTAGVERLLSLAGNLAGIDPQAVDNIDIDFALEKMSSDLGNDPRLIRSPAQLAAIRKARQQQQADQQAHEASMAGVQGAKVLSETDVGGGQNALQKIMGQ